MYKKFNTQAEAQSFIDLINLDRGYDPTQPFDPKTMGANNYANPLEGVDGWYVPLDAHMQEEYEGVESFESQETEVF